MVDPQGEQVADMVCALLRFERGRLKLDATDAAGAALCHLNQTRLGAAGATQYAGWKGFLDSNPGRVRR